MSSLLAKSIITAITRNSVDNTINFDLNLEPALGIPSFVVSDVLSFSLDYTYTDQDAGGGSSTLTQTFDINVRTDDYDDGDTLLGDDEDFLEAIISEGTTLEELIEESEIEIPVIDSTNSTTPTWLIDDDYMAALLNETDLTNSTQFEEFKDEGEDYLEEGDYSDDGILDDKKPQEDDRS